ncbi:histidine kinase [Piscinibacter sp. XHJ-5]|uniref:histidine kinase n=1 Tax=Piscinibacter sp. XHJ-5 TaxID=3037797 RepID=UPI00245343E5|nr:histidine kinase [Piscinibacter sp. XHJ-5]
MGWRHVVLALGLKLVRETFGPLGGIFFLPFDPVGFDLVASILNGSWVVPNVLIIYCVLVADEAFNAGVPALRAYGLAVVAMSTLVPVVGWHLAGLMGWWRLKAPSMLFGVLAMLFQGGLAVSIYAYWRVTQRAMRQVQAAETERVRNEQRVHAARLLALQSRVEPQMLFDALGRIGELHAREPQAADALLADLIALLRAMLPGARSSNSTVEREFALVDAWLRVTSEVTPGHARVHLRIEPGAHNIGIAAMLVLPLLRTVLAAAHTMACEWSLTARLVGDRLRVTLQADQDVGVRAAGWSESADLSSLQDRLMQLFGEFASLTVSPMPAALTLDLPRLQEDRDDDRLDR